MSHTNNNPPDNFMCPITQEIMTNPVTGSDGHTYEKTAIEEWLRNRDTSPMTRAIMRITSLVPNIRLRASIEEWQNAAGGQNSPDPASPNNQTHQWLQRLLTLMRNKLSTLEQVVMASSTDRFSGVVNHGNQAVQQIIDTHLLPHLDETTQSWVEFLYVSSFLLLTLGKYDWIAGTVFATSLMCMKHYIPSNAALQSMFEDASTRNQVEVIIGGLLIMAVVLVAPVWLRICVLMSSVGVRLAQHMNRDVSDNGLFCYLLGTWIFSVVDWWSSNSYSSFFLTLFTLFVIEMMAFSRNHIPNKFCGSICFILMGGYQTHYPLFLMSWFFQALVPIVSKYQTKLLLSWCHQEVLLYAACVHMAVACLWPGMTMSDSFNQLVPVLLLLAERMGPQSSRQPVWLAALVLAFLFPAPGYGHYSFLYRAGKSVYDVVYLLTVKFVMAEKLPFLKTTRTFTEYSNHMTSLFGANLLRQNDICYALFIDTTPKFHMKFELVSVVSEGVVRNSRGVGSCVVRKVTAPSDSGAVEVPLSRMRCADEFAFAVASY